MGSDDTDVTPDDAPAKTPVGRRARHRVPRSRLRAAAAATTDEPDTATSGTVEPEQAVEPERVVEPEQAVESAKAVEPEPVAEPEPVEAVEPEPVAEPEPVEAVEPEQPVEPAKAVEPEPVAEPDAVAGDTDTAESEPDAPVAAAAPKRKRWFRRKDTPAPAVADESATEPTEEPTDEAPVAETAVEEPTADLTADEPAEDTPADDEPAPKVSLVKASAGDSTETVVPERKPVGRLLVAAVAAAAALFVAAAGVAGAVVEPYLANQAQVDTKLIVATTATDAIKTLWTYTPDNMESLPDRASTYLTGDFEERFRSYVDGLAPTNKQAQVTNTTEVTGAAIESIDGKDATAIVYTNSTFTSPRTNNVPSMRYQSYRVVLQRQDSEWKITDMVPITQLDLTPKLAG